MASIYGGTAEDRYFESVMMKHLEDAKPEKLICAECHQEYEQNETNTDWFCSECLELLETQE